MKSENYSRKRLDKYSRYMDIVSSGLLGDPKLKVPDNFNDLMSVLKTNRVTVRWFNKNKSLFKGEKEVDDTLKSEKKRLDGALKLIQKITDEFDRRKLPIVFIKTFENPPDLGQDIDVYTNISVRKLDDIFINKFKATLESASFSDKIARKRNYMINGKYVFEIHCSRLGQVGEDTKLAEDLLKRREKVKTNGITTYVPRAEYRLLLCVLQRVYRHLNIRICDVYNTLNLIDSLDWIYLKKISLKYGVWRGVLLYLSYIDKIVRYYGKESGIKKHMRIKNWPSKIKDRGRHFRFPEISTSFSAYSRKLISYVFHLNISGLLRLFLVFPLGVMHVIESVFFEKNKIW